MDLTLYHPRVSDDGLKVLTRIIRWLIPKRERRYPLERIVAAILHRADNGCKWRSLDRGVYLPWHVAYDGSVYRLLPPPGPRERHRDP